MMLEGRPIPNPRPVAAAVAALLLVAGAQYAWNAHSLYPLSGYDVPGHAGYILHIIREGRLPDPYEGWSTFHPPLYYLIGSVVWRWLEPFGPHAVSLGLIGIGAVAMLGTGLVAFILIRRLSGSPAVAWVATALVLFLPSAQIAATSIGNEAFAAGLSALALLPLLALHSNPRDARAGALTGLTIALALTAKFTGLFVAVAAIVPFLRRDFDRRMLRSLALLLAIVVLFAGPVYLRNFRLTGTLFPMTRQREPVRTVEGWFTLRPREVGDYLSFNPRILLRPSIFHVPHQAPSIQVRNQDMTNVWGLLYASTWYDAFANRILISYHRDGVLTGPLMTFLGLVPTCVMLLGFVVASARALRSRGRSPEAPLVIMALVGIATFISFTWRAPATVAVKGAYLLPLAVPAAIFFSAGAGLFSRRIRFVLLLFSTMAAVAAAVIFTNGIVFQSVPTSQLEIDSWRGFAQTLGSREIVDAMTFLLGGR